MRLQTGGDHPALKRGDCRSEHVLLLEVFAHRLQQEGGFVMFERTLGQPGQHGRMILGLHPAKPQMVQDGVEVRTAGHATPAVGLESHRVDLESSRQAGHHRPWSRLEISGTEAEIAHGTQLERRAQTIGVTVIGVDEGTGVLGQGAVGDEVPVRAVIGEISQPFPLLCGAKGARHRVVSAVIKNQGYWKPSRINP